MERRTTVRAWFAEGAVILGSILLAFAIDATWDARQESRLESSMVRAVAAEVRANQVGLARVESDADERLARIDDFLALTPSSALALEPDEARRLLQISGGITHAPMVTAAANLLGSTPSDSAGLAVRELVGAWTDALSRYEVERLEMKRRQDAFQHHLAPYAALLPSGGVGPVDVMLRRGDARLIAKLRADEDLVAAAVEHGGQVWFSRLIIRQLIPAADTLLLELEAFESRRR